MPVAYIMLNCGIGAEDEVLQQIRKIENVEEAYRVYGVYDIVVKVNADTEQGLKEVSAWKIRRLDKVRSTLTMIATEKV